MQDMLQNKTQVETVNSSSDRMKYNTLQLRYIQPREKAFDMCPEVRQIQAKRLVIFTTMLCSIL